MNIGESQVLLRPLKVSDPTGLVRFSTTFGTTTTSITYAQEFEAWKQQIDAFDDVSAYRLEFANLQGDGGAEQVPIARVTAELTFSAFPVHAYTAMRFLRPISMVLGLAILLMNTGDCVNLLFADAKEADCCMKADCPTPASPQMDSCCAKPGAPTKYVQAPTQRSLSQPSVTTIDFPAEAFAGPTATAYFSSGDNLHSPTGSLNNLNTPLLI
jgi:hypothetical protein